MAVADTGLDDVWPIQLSLAAAHNIRARIASNLSDRPAAPADGSFWFRCRQAC
jgi:hypothetical protein